jgi:hypothetical protein
MSSNHCPQENTVARMARTGMWDEATTRHARACPMCREVSAAAVRMLSIASFDEDPQRVSADVVAAPLPDASLLWWKHELMQRYKQRERAARPIRVMEVLTGAVGLLALLAVLTLAGLLLPDVIETAAAQGSSQLLASAISGGFSLSPDTLLTGTVLAALLGAALLYPLWREQ